MPEMLIENRMEVRQSGGQFLKQTPHERRKGKVTNRSDPKFNLSLPPGSITNKDPGRTATEKGVGAIQAVKSHAEVDGRDQIDGCDSPRCSRRPTNGISLQDICGSRPLSRPIYRPIPHFCPNIETNRA